VAQYPALPKAAHFVKRKPSKKYKNSKKHPFPNIQFPTKLLTVELSNPPKVPNYQLFPMHYNRSQMRSFAPSYSPNMENFFVQNLFPNPTMPGNPLFPNFAHFRVAAQKPHNLASHVQRPSPLLGPKNPLGLQKREIALGKKTLDQNGSDVAKKKRPLKHHLQSKSQTSITTASASKTLHVNPIFHR